MKLRLILTLLLFAFIQLKAQKNSDATSLAEVVALSEKHNKPILLIVMPPPGASSSNVRAAYKENDMVKSIKKHFLIFETNLSNTDIKPIISKYKVSRFPAFLFMHTSKEVFHSDFGSSTFKNKYQTMLNTAINLSKEPSGKLLENAYLEDKTNNKTIQKLIEYRNQKGIGSNAELIEQYAINLKQEDFKDYKTVLYILKGGPYAYGNAYKLAHSDRKIIDSIYKSEPLQTRIDMNNAIISNTLQQAIKTNNPNQAHYAASFARTTYGKNVAAGNRVYSSNMISYHKAVNDTANYFKLAIPFYDRYYMTLSADSIKKIDEKKSIAFAEKNIKKPNENTKVISKAEFESLKKRMPTTAERNTILMVVGNNSQNSYATTLNNVAWTFYETGTTNINYLTKAMLWSRRALELDAKAAYYDTLAHLLYRLGYEAEAIKTQEEAIAKAKTQKISTENMSNELKKMKNKTL